MSNLMLVVSCGSDMSIRLWDGEKDWVQARTFVDHDHSVHAVRFMPGDTVFVSASRDRTVKMWSVESGCVLHPMLWFFWLTQMAVTVSRRSMLMTIGYEVSFRPMTESGSPPAQTIMYVCLDALPLSMSGQTDTWF